MFQTVIYKQKFYIDGCIQKHKGRITLLNAILIKTKGKFWLQVDEKSKLIKHSSQGVVTPIHAIEVCSGIGAMGQGMKVMSPPNALLIITLGFVNG